MRITGVPALLAAVMVVGSLLTIGEEATPVHATPVAYEFCPPALRLPSAGMKWTEHRLRPGITLSETSIRGDKGRVDIDVLRVHLDHRHVSVAPLHGAMSARHRLTSLASRRHLVAATNGMYFSFAYGAPTVPFIEHRRPFVLSTRHQQVAGIGVNHRAQDGKVWLSGRVRSGAASRPLVAVNEPEPRLGLSIYTKAWGRHRVPLPTGAKSRMLRHRRIISGTARHHFVPRHGQLLVAKGRADVHWLRSLARHRRVHVSRHVETNAAVPFDQAYGVGTHVVAAPDHVRSGLYCRRSEIYAARTSIAWSRSRSTLMLVTAESPRAADHYGLDENQMSGLLVALRAAGGYALDGGGSTTMVARMPWHRGRLSLRAVARHGQRAIPVGVGVFYRR